MQTANDGSIECWSAYKVENQVCLGQIVRFVWVKNSGSIIHVCLGQLFQVWITNFITVTHTSSRPKQY